MTFPVGQKTIIRLVYGELHQFMPIAREHQRRERLEGTRRRALDLSVPFRASLPDLYRQEDRIFAAEGLPIPWPALSPLYRAWKAKHYPGKTMLRRTDRLYISLTTPGGENVAEVAPRTIRFGTTVPWWRHHQVGTRRMPARPPVVLLPETFRAIATRSMRWVAEGKT